MGIAQTFFDKDLRDQLFYVAIAICYNSVLTLLVTSYRSPKYRRRTTLLIKQYRRHSIHDEKRSVHQNSYRPQVLSSEPPSTPLFPTFSVSMSCYEASYGWALVGLMVAAILSCQVGFICRRRSESTKHLCAIFWYVCCAMLMPLLYFLPSDAGAGFIVLQIIKGLCTGAIGAMAFSMAGDSGHRYPKVRGTTHRFIFLSGRSHENRCSFCELHWSPAISCWF